MGKYIIELPDDENLISWWTYTGTEDGIKHVNSREVVKTPYIEPDLEAIKQEAYQKGLDDGWESARKIAEIQVGDEVKGLEALKSYNGALGIVTRLWQYREDSENLNVMWNDGNTGCYNKTHVVKTGRHFPEFVEVIKKMRGEKNEAGRSNR